MINRILIRTSLIGLLAALAIGFVPALSQAVTKTTADNGGIIALGSKRDPQSGRIVQGYAIQHPWQGSISQNARAGGSQKNSCYTFLARGAKWKTVEPWVMNANNNSGLSATTVFNTQAAALATWEDAADGIVGNGNAVQIFGTGTATNSTLAADNSSPDGLNEVYFGDAGGANVIAVTTVWGIFSGPGFQRELSEWDQVFDQVDFDWSLGGAVGSMDFQNIATHEDGHAAGLGHPSGACTEETMYQYADNGETKKRDLNTGDIAGINELY